MYERVARRLTSSPALLAVRAGATGTRRRRRLRELRQGPAGRHAGGAGGVSREGTRAARGVRRGTPRAVARVHGRRATREGARRRPVGSARSRPRPARAVCRGLVRDRAEEVRRCVRAAARAGRKRRRRPRSRTTWASIQLRRGGSPQAGRATYWFTRATQAQPDPDYFFNLGYAYWFEQDVPAAIYWLREAVRRNPTDGDAHFVLGAALQVSGSATEAQRELELALSASPRGIKATAGGPRSGCRAGSSARTPRSNRRARPAQRRRWPRRGSANKSELDGVSPRSGTSTLRRAERRRGDRRAAARVVPVTIPGRSAPAARPHLPARRAGPARR